MMAATASLSELISSLNDPLEPQAVELPPVLRARLGRVLDRPPAAVVFDVYGTLLVSASGEVGTAAGGDGDVDPFVRLLSMIAPEAVDASESLRRGLTAEIRRSHEQSRRGGTAVPEVDIREVWRVTLAASPHASLRAAAGDRAAVARVAVIYEQLANPTAAMPGAAGLLRVLRRSGVVLGIVSNAQFYTPLVMHAHLGAEPTALGFAPSMTVYSFEVGEAKPSDAMFSSVVPELRRRGIGAEQALYVGNDMRNDVATAARAGLQTCLFAGDARSLRLRARDPSLAGVVPDTVVDGLRGVADVCGLVDRVEDWQ